MESGAPFICIRIDETGGGHNSAPGGGHSWLHAVLEAEGMTVDDDHQMYTKRVTSFLPVTIGFRW